MINDPSPLAQIAELGVHLQRLSGRLDQLDDDHNDIAELVHQLAKGTADIRQALTANGPPQPTPPPPCWASMSAERAAVEWDALADWLEHTFVPWYDITRNQLPDCWALHRPAVIELSWLHHTHRAAHQPDALPHLLAQWHTEWKPAVLQSITDAIPRRGSRTCTPGYHLASDTDRTISRGRTAASAGRDVERALRVSPAEQPAERQYWNPHFNHAREMDLARRLSPEPTALARTDRPMRQGGAGAP